MRTTVKKIIAAGIMLSAAMFVTVMTYAEPVSGPKSVSKTITIFMRVVAPPDSEGSNEAVNEVSASKKKTEVEKTGKN